MGCLVEAMTQLLTRDISDDGTTQYSTRPQSTKSRAHVAEAPTRLSAPTWSNTSPTAQSAVIYTVKAHHAPHEASTSPPGIHATEVDTSCNKAGRGWSCDP